MVARNNHLTLLAEVFAKIPQDDRALLLSQKDKHGDSLLASTCKYGALECTLYLLSLADETIFYTQIVCLLQKHAHTLTPDIMEALTLHQYFLDALRSENFQQATTLLYQLSPQQRPWKVIQQHWNKLSAFIQNDALAVHKLDSCKIAKNLLQDMLDHAPS